MALDSAGWWLSVSGGIGRRLSVQVGSHPGRSGPDEPEKAPLRAPVPLCIGRWERGLAVRA